MESGASSAGNVRGRMNDKVPRRSWSTQEEEVLINALKDLIVEGWKTDNGFRVGYLGKLEAAMKKVFLSTVIKGQPHINLKITKWKRLYAIASGALSCTGVGYNETTGLLECTNEQWDLVAKNDPNAKNKRYTPFPMYNTWIELFGKDRATGETAEDVMGAVNELVKEDTQAQEHVVFSREKEQTSQDGLEGDYEVDLEGLFDDSGNSICQMNTGAQIPKTSGQKRKVADPLDGLIQMVGQITRNMDDKLDKIARFIGYEYGLGEKRKKLFEMVGNVPGLTMDQKLDISEILAEKVDLLEMFTGLLEDARARYVHQLLEKQ